MDINAYTNSNKEAWDASAKYHLESEEWQKLLSGFATPSFSTFDDTMRDILLSLPVEGKSVVQVGCNNGREILSAILLGAKNGLGIDQSAAFLQQADKLNEVAKLPCEFLCCDVYDLPEHLHNQFDVCFITIGVLNWMPDLQAFFSAISPLVKSGGKLAIYETHPFMEMFVPDKTDPFTPSVSYFSKTPYKSEAAIVYDGSQPDETPSSYWFNHSLSNVINSSINAGFSLTQLSEYAHTNREVDYDIYENQEAQIPMCFSLLADKV
ncbi:MAG: class I SAM-dependent methyltransferase [Leucothrix sp.]